MQTGHYCLVVQLVRTEVSETFNTRSSRVGAAKFIMSEILDTLIPNAKRVTVTSRSTYWAKQFLPEQTPWPKGVIQIAENGVVNDRAGYYLIIPMRDFICIRPGAWILYDSMANVVSYRDDCQAQFSEMTFTPDAK